MTSYLHEHHDVVLGAIRHSGDFLLRPGTSWETTAWVRSERDAGTLQRNLQQSVFTHVAGAGVPAIACVGVVQALDPTRSNPARLEARWGVRVTIGSGSRASSGGS